LELSIRKIIELVAKIEHFGWKRSKAFQEAVLFRAKKKPEVVENNFRSS
jgi:hypothetical protein